MRRVKIPVATMSALLAVALTASMTACSSSAPSGGAQNSVQPTLVYQANVQVSATTPTGTPAIELAPSYAALARSPAVTRRVMRDLLLTMSDQQLMSMITYDVPAKTALINVHVTDSDPRRAAAIANAVASELVNAVQHLANPSGKPVVRLVILHPAVVPTAPFKPK